MGTTEWVMLTYWATKSNAANVGNSLTFQFFDGSSCNVDLQSRSLSKKQTKRKRVESHTKEYKSTSHENAIYTYVCAACGKQFEAYGNNHRKYCSHKCYINDRFYSRKARWFLWNQRAYFMAFIRWRERPSLCPPSFCHQLPDAFLSVHKKSHYLSLYIYNSQRGDVLWQSRFGMKSFQRTFYYFMMSKCLFA